MVDVHSTARGHPRSTVTAKTVFKSSNGARGCRKRRNAAGFIKLTYGWRRSIASWTWKRNLAKGGLGRGRLAPYWFPAIATGRREVLLTFSVEAGNVAKNVVRSFRQQLYGIKSGRFAPPSHRKQ